MPFAVVEELVLGVMSLVLTTVLAVPVLRLMPRGLYPGWGRRPHRYSRDPRRARREKAFHIVAIAGFVLLTAALLGDGGLRVGRSTLVGPVFCVFQGSEFHSSRTGSYLVLDTSCGPMHLDDSVTALQPGRGYVMTYTVRRGLWDTTQYLQDVLVRPAAA